MNKKKIIIISGSSLALLSLIIGAVFFFTSKSSKQEETQVILTPAIQCKGVQTARELSLEMSYHIVKVADYTEEELKEFARLQILYGFTNFQYNPLQSPLQFSMLRSKPVITLMKVDNRSYERELVGESKPPEFLNLKKYKWPNKIGIKTPSMTVNYKANFEVDFCLKEVAILPESIDFYFPVDPIYAYYTLDRKHWTYRVLEPWGKTIPINLCQNLHQFYDTDLGYAQNYWRLWNPMKRGKEVHTMHYLCHDFLKEGEDYLKMKPHMKLIAPRGNEKFQTSWDLNADKKVPKKDLRIRIVMPKGYLNDEDYYVASVTQIFEGHDFLSNIPHLEPEKFYLFRLLEKISQEIDEVKFNQTIKNRDSYLFKLSAISKLTKEKLDLTVEMGSEFSKFTYNCFSGFTYSRDVLYEENLNLDECEREFYFAPLASQFSSFFNLRPKKSRNYYLLGQPGLASYSPGAYLINYSLMPAEELADYITREDHEEAFYVVSKEGLINYPIELPQNVDN